MSKRMRLVARQCTGFECQLICSVTEDIPREPGGDVRVAPVNCDGS